MKEILQLPNKELKKHINILAKDYNNRTGNNVCLSCPSDVQNMLNYLKNIYMTSQFQLRKPSVIYKIRKGFGETISNQKMTDELAIQFLKVKKERIELFAKYPENWLELIGEKEDLTVDLTESETESKPKRKYTKKAPCKGCKDKNTKASITKTKSNDTK